jgi:TetR/AcrR family transcriptional regulator
MIRRLASASRPGEKRDPEATRRALLGAAAALFSERGFDAVSVEDIAEQAGFNKALVSYHFGGKRGLYVSVLQSGFAAMAERLLAIETKAGSAPEALHRFLDAFLAVHREHPGFPTLFIREALAGDIEPAVALQLRRIIGVTRRLAVRGAREGAFRRTDPLLLHIGLVGSLAFFFGTEPARRRARAEGHLPFRPPTPRAFVRHLEEMTLWGLAPRPSSARRKGGRV